MTTNTEMYQSYTGQAGNLSRQLALVGAGLIWVFHGLAAGKERELSVALDPCLTWSLYFICGSLVVDVAQYSIGSIFWYKAFSNSPEGEAKDAKGAILFANTCIFLKLGAMTFAYLFIVIFLFRAGVLA